MSWKERCLIKEEHCRKAEDLVNLRLDALWVREFLWPMPKDGGSAHICWSCYEKAEVMPQDDDTKRFLKKTRAAAAGRYSTGDNRIIDLVLGISMPLEICRIPGLDFIYFCEWCETQELGLISDKEALERLPEDCQFKSISD